MCSCRSLISGHIARRFSRTRVNWLISFQFRGHNTKFITLFVQTRGQTAPAHILTAISPFDNPHANGYSPLSLQP